AAHRPERDARARDEHLHAGVSRRHAARQLRQRLAGDVARGAARHRHQRRAPHRRGGLLPRAESWSAPCMRELKFKIEDLRFKIGVAAGVAAGVVVLASTLVLAQARPQPGVRLPLDRLEAQMFHVSAGKRLKPKAWPNGARVAVGLSFDVDNATADLATGNLISESISRGEYRAVDGLPRILRLLDKHQVPASFFIPAATRL